jgi:hypothetical protein
LTRRVDQARRYEVSGDSGGGQKGLTLRDKGPDAAKFDPVKGASGPAARKEVVPSELNMREVRAVAVKVDAGATAQAAEAPVVDAALRLWADRIGSSQSAEPGAEAASDTAPENTAQVEAAAEAAPEEESGEPGSEGEVDVEMEMGSGGFGKGSNGSNGGKSGGGDFASRQQGFEISARAADVFTKDAGAGAAVRSRHVEVTQTVKEMARARVQSNAATGKTAEVELSIAGERVVVKVSVKGGRVDVDVRGLEAAEMARLRQELRPELERMALELGDVTDEDELAGEGRGKGRDQRSQTDTSEEAVFDLSALIEGTDPALAQVWGGQ